MKSWKIKKFWPWSVNASFWKRNLFPLPRYMWRKVQTLSCKSLACSSWAGGCIEKSYHSIKENINYSKSIHHTLKTIFMPLNTYKGRKDLLCSTTGNRKPSMRACVTCSQSFTKELCLWFIWFQCKIWCQQCLLIILMKNKE